MKLKINLKYIATPSKIFMTVLIVLIAVSILQGIIIQIERTFRLSATTKPKAELTQEEKRLNRIRNSAKEFLPDGTIHLVHKPRRTPGRMDESEIEQIYDANDDLLWEGPGNKRPYEYLSWAKQLRRYRDGFTREQMKQTQMITTDFSRNVRIPVRSDNKTEQIWRYHPGAQFFKGYNTNGGGNRLHRLNRIYKLKIKSKTIRRIQTLYRLVSTGFFKPNVTVADTKTYLSNQF